MVHWQEDRMITRYFPVTKYTIRNRTSLHHMKILDFFRRHCLNLPVAIMIVYVRSARIHERLNQFIFFNIFINNQYI
jgi:hypothetical protein